MIVYIWFTFLPNVFLPKLARVAYFGQESANSGPLVDFCSKSLGNLSPKSAFVATHPAGYIPGAYPL